MDMDGLTVCAIDPSIACTGVAIIRVEDYANKKFKILSKTSLLVPKSIKNRWDRKEAARELFEFWMKHQIDDVDFAIFENYSYGSVGHLADLGEFGGMLKHYLWLNKKKFDMLAPSTIKKIVAGHGFAEKSAVADGIKKFITNITDISFNNFDETDAVAVGIAYLLNLENKEKDDESRKSKKSARKSRRSIKRKSA